MMYLEGKIRELLFILEKMVHPEGLLGCASSYGPLLTQRYPPWC